MTRRAAACLSVLFAVCAAALIAVLAASAMFSTSVRREADNVSDLNFQPRPGARLPLDADLVDETGRAVALGKYFSKSPVILALEYLRCTSLCGVTLRNLIAGGLNRLPLQAGRDYQVVAVSIDPRDRPTDAAAARAKYARLLDRRSDGGLHFLTAAPAAVRQIADAVGFRYRYDSFLDAYIHPAGFVVVTPDGVISRYVEGVSTSPRELIDAFADAQQGRSRGLLDRIILLCRVQGAPLGRFTAPVIAALMAANIAAGLMLIAIFAAIRRQG